MKFCSLAVGAGIVGGVFSILHPSTNSWVGSLLGFGLLLILAPFLKESDD